MSEEEQQQELNGGRRTWAEQGGAAFPVPEIYTEAGLTQLAAFAALAPAEIPGWFNAIYKPIRPCPPVRSVMDAPAEIRAEVAKLVAEVDIEPEWWVNKPTAVVTWMDSWHKECEAAAHWRMCVREPDRYFAWRMYYAQSMLAYIEGANGTPDN